MESAGALKCASRKCVTMDNIETLQALLPRLADYGERAAVVVFRKDEKEQLSYAKLAEQEGTR